MKEIIINENGLYVRFDVREDGVTELTKFMASGLAEISEIRPRREEKDIFPVIEINVTGRSTREMHGYCHNSGSLSGELKYRSHEIKKEKDGKELVITLKTDEDVYAFYHMRFFDGIPMVRVWTVLENRGSNSLPVEYVSSFVYQDLCGDGKELYHEKTDLFVPYSSWDGEVRWKKEDIEDINLSGMCVDGFNTPGFGCNRFYYTGLSSWSSVEYLPMGLVHDREIDESYIFQIESSGQWHAEFDSEPGKRLTVCLSGPTEQEHGWWLDLKPNVSFETIPVAFGAVRGELNEAMAALTGYRRAIRRPNADDDRDLNVVFNDYMNCLFGNPTEEKDIAVIDKAAEMGCEYFCMDCGWYDKGYWWDRVGEWKESKERFPRGIKYVSDYAKSKGLIMGIWLEIEVMGVASEFANKCPDDWFICRHGKRHIDHDRYLLDFRNPEVYNYCMDVIERLINDYGIGFFKMDYNITQGRGSDLYCDSPSGAMLDHYRALHRWYEEIFERHPDLVIENCGSGAQRMDYGMLRLLSLQSTSDQTDYIYNSYIAANVATAVTPEQAGMWVYPYEDDREHVICNMVNGLLLRPYMSGMVWKYGQESMELLKEGVALYKKIRSDIRKAVPFWPQGLNTLHDEAFSYGVRSDDKAYLAVFAPKTDRAEIPLSFKEKEIKDVKVIYPSTGNCESSFKDGILSVKMPSKACARLFEICFE